MGDYCDGSVPFTDVLHFLQKMYSMTPGVFQHLAELREKYTYNITPFTAAMATGKQPNKSAATIFSDDDDEDEMENITCFGGIFPPQTASHRGIATFVLHATRMSRACFPRVSCMSRACLWHCSVSHIVI